VAVVDAVIADRALAAMRVVAQWGRVRAAYLFGSQVQGTADQWSDIDIAVFVEGAEEWDFDRLSRVCGVVQRQVGLDIEMHVFPASSYEHPVQASFAQYIVDHGAPLNVDDVEPMAR